MAKYRWSFRYALFSVPGICIYLALKDLVTLALKQCLVEQFQLLHVSCIPEVLGTMGVLVKPDCKHSIAKIFAKLIEEDDYREN